MKKHEDDIVKLDSSIRKCIHKFSQKLLNDVTNIVFSRSDEIARNQLLEFLFKTGFVKNVVWKHYNCDVTDNHLELFVTLAVYDSSRWKSQGEESLLDLFLSHKDALVIFDRLLGVTQDGTFQNTRFKIITLSFILLIVKSSSEQACDLVQPLFDVNIWSCLNSQLPLITNQLEKYKSKVSQIHNKLKAVQGSYNLKTRWLFHIIKGFSTAFYQWKEAVVKFIISILRNYMYKNSITPFLTTLNVCSLFRTSNDKWIEGLVNYLDWLLSPKHILEFSLLQQKIQEMFKDKLELTNTVVGFVSRYSTSKREIQELFEHHLTIEDAKNLLLWYSSDELISNYECLGLNQSTKSFFIDVILSRFFPIELSSFSMSFNFWNTFSETDINYDFHPHLQFPGQHKSFKDIETEITYRQVETAKVQIFKHVSSVMSRFKVESSTLFKGSSKYFTGVKSITPITGSKYQLISTSTVPDVGYILLVELIKSDSKGSSLRKLGVRNLRICKTEKMGQLTMAIHCANLDYPDAYKNFIVLPDLQSLKYLDYLQEIKRRNIPSSGENNEVSDNEPATKKQKLETSDTDTTNKEFIKTPKFSNIDEILSKYQTNRVLVVTSSRFAVNHYTTLSKSFIRYGNEKCVHELVQIAKGYYKDLTNGTGKAFQNVSECDLITLRERLVKTSSNSEAIVDSCQNGNNNQSLTSDDFKKLEFVMKVHPICTSNIINQSTWQFLLNKFNTMISSEDLYSISYSSPFDIIVFWNCHASTLPLVLLKQPAAKKIIVNGECLDYFKNITYFQPTIRDEIDSFNPGFVFKNQLISVKNQVEEAEYSVLLYFYMRLLGYPSDSIAIWVSCKRMEILIHEVVSKSDLKKKLGVPEVLYNKTGDLTYIQIQYSIISMFSDEGYTEVSLSGKQGNYFISCDINKDLRYLTNSGLGPGHDLCIVEGEKFEDTRQDRSAKKQNKLRELSQLEKRIRSMIE